MTLIIQRCQLVVQRTFGGQFSISFCLLRQVCLKLRVVFRSRQLLEMEAFSKYSATIFIDATRVDGNG